MGTRLELLNAHDAIVLLKNSFAIPKLTYILRTSPCFLSPSLVSYDEIFRKITSRITNIDLCGNEIGWTQASQPVDLGGLGIRSAVQLAPSTLLASAEGSSKLRRLILPHSFRESSEPALEKSFNIWGGEYNLTPPTGPSVQYQRMWDISRAEDIMEKIINDTSDVKDRARLLAASKKESGAWLKALPISAVGLRMDDETIRIAVGLRLGAVLCVSHSCTYCGENVDHTATHGLSCKWGEGRHPKHASINDIIHRALSSSQVPSKLEPPGFYRDDGRRPDGCSLIPWKSGKILVWDVTFPDLYAPSYRTAAAKGVGSIAKMAEIRKKAKYKQIDATNYFVPIAIESSGVIGTEGQELISDRQ